MSQARKNKRKKSVSSKVIFRMVGILLIVLYMHNSNAQQKSGLNHLSLHAMAKAYGDSVVIRWAPGDATAWKLCNDSGYQVVRTDYTDPKHPVTTSLTLKALLPMSLTQMKNHLDTADQYAAIAAQAMYGDNFELTNVPPATFAGKISQGRSAMNFRFSFAMMSADFSAPVAGALALRWVDRQVKIGGYYRYVIFSHGGDGVYRVDSAEVSVVNIRAEKEAVPKGLAAFGFDRKVELHWNRRQLPGYDAYYIQRSDDEGRTWHLLNKAPFFSPYHAPAQEKTDTLSGKIASVLRDHQVFFDSIPQNYKAYYYRISGLNAFGERSPYTHDTVAVHGVDLTPPPPPQIDSAWNFSGRDIKIRWTQRQPSQDLAGYIITRSNDAQGPFYPIEPGLLSIKDTSFIDSSATAHQPNYYVVVATDSAGNISQSLPFVAYLTDSLPPEPPSGVAGTIDSSGVVHLRWNRNTEPDLKGYKVYYSYVPDYQYSQLTRFAMTGNTFTDTIPMNTLNRKIYYRVVAVDRNNNHSDYSAIASLDKPVVIPPSAPAPGEIHIDRSGAHIEWIESRSEGAAGYEIYRREQGKDWQPAARLNQDWQEESLLYTDSTILPNTDYDYAAETIDSTGIHSARSFAVHVRYTLTHTLTTPEAPRALWEVKQREVMLSWNYQQQGNYFFIVYKGIQGGALIPWRSFDKGTVSCRDRQVNKGSYQYAIRVITRNHGKSSEVSKAVVVSIPDKTK